MAVLDRAAVWLPADSRALRAPGYRPRETQVVPAVANEHMNILLDSNRKNVLGGSILSRTSVFATFLYS